MLGNNYNMENQFNQVNQPMFNPLNQMNPNPSQNGQFDPNQMQNFVLLLRQNPNLFNQLSDAVKSNNNNFTEQNIFNNQNYLRMAKEGKVPRNIFSQVKQNAESIPLKNNNNSDIVNVCFEITSGQKFNEQASKSMKIKDLFIRFITRLGFNQSIIEKDIYFLFNGTNVNINQNKTLRELGIENNSKIIVLDTKGIIGAK